MPIQTKEELRQVVQETVNTTPISDIHTHLFTEDFGSILLWGIDELLTYHYLVAETFRFHPELSYDAFWAMSKTEQADLIWQTLFLDHTPYSEACRGVLTVLNRLGLDVESRDLASYREYFKKLTTGEYIDKVFELSGVTNVCMTNDPFADAERAVWEKGTEADPRFHTALRIDPLLNQWETTWARLKEWGYEVEQELTETTLKSIRSFLKDWIERMNPLYMAVSLPPTFAYPEASVRGRLIDECILPVAREAGIPFAMMIGVRKKVNPALGDAGDSVGKSDVSAVENICAQNPDNKFLCTILSRDDQHELTVAARKFRNLHVFGCWWFLNNPSIIEEMTRMRFELLGASVTPQHSDCRVLDQLLYKWDHSRIIIAKVLYDKYSDVMDTGWKITREEIARDCADLFGGSFWKFLGKPDPNASSGAEKKYAGSR
ncbi:glucuronate isomerase [Paenibacillus aurantius]|uniref:Glucuronate isomerase n=1 Tax=Paenibacillus aurantius TaxID=2918900 RepID=A0AA96LI30_9BACL|nr:glucuronate isomerase [Paenibacillus aurantius]WNQ13383.1 glucuronate isomerase [Paenibacillus aurantius]